MKCEIRSIIGTRNEQQDHAGMLTDDKGLLAVVCDGIGSRVNGGLSAETAVKMYLDNYKNSHIDNFSEFIVNITDEINEAIRNNFGNGCGTTVVLAHIADNMLHWLSVGDSRLYIMRDNKLRQITKDHNYKYMLDKRLENGSIGIDFYESELEKGDHLASFLGMGPIDIMDINLKPFPLENGDKLLLSSDGIYKSLGYEGMLAVLKKNSDTADIADELIYATEHCGKKNIDNSTFALISI